ncbi:MAG TPA: cupredoxin domain-containing protein [Dehalococcoidia bacterium]|nr:cupredoxin domain-containing protein [Dehalococcoidia bacterium]
MEYVQTVLVQIEASAMDEASRPGGLLAELGEHRSFLRQQHGFQDMQISRSINAEGNVLLVVETRWQDDNSLVEYETHEPNVMSIVNKYPELIVRDSLQVLDMETVRTEAARHVDAATEVSERLALPLLVPMGVLAFALLVIYGLSRIYLEVNSDVATPLAAGISVGILAIAWYLSSRPSIAAWQVASISVAAAALLTGGTLLAVIDGGEGEATGGTPVAGASPTAAASPSTPGALTVEMGDNFFKFEGQEEPTIPAKAGVETTIDLTNVGAAIHNMRVFGADNELNTPDDFVSEPNLIPAATTGKITFKLDQAGAYDFHCDFHPDLMKGKIQVE